MTRILFTTMPITGHVRPALPVARALVHAGHEVVWYSGPMFETPITRTGARFVRSSVEFDSIDENGDVLQSMGDTEPGLSGFKQILKDLFIDPIPAYAAEIGPLIDATDPDVVVADHSFLAAPMLARLRGVPAVMFAISPLHVSSVDTAPFGTGLMPSATPLGRVRNRALQWVMSSLVFRDTQRALERATDAVGFPRPEGFFMDWGLQLADRYLTANIPEFEYPRSDLPAAVEFVGPMLPDGVDDWTPPEWWSDLERARARGRPVVLVTQGTVGSDPANLILPAISALADEDVLVVVTSHPLDPDDLLSTGRRPANLRIERFVPFTELLPLTDLMITNGGYGGVQTALAFGVPLLVAGRSEDKMEVNARVAWSGAGLSLGTGSPNPRRIRGGALKVLGDPRYRSRATELRTAYARYSGAERAAEIIAATARTGDAPTARPAR
ncbi:MGT family glycosyltransferase [Nocardiopsis sp. Huas11]|uniref:glycosyltransferase n=1 Tax=Nocardiopsis sp. Huas11 TaxID=2183912 RepID=UPI000F156896|nr:glycosyltransferase [Nocardiopsis sp. Huas11]RKS10365.1 MGT family glycosyltransferase [Nocardiopsis sp. Huas11]